MPPLRIWWSAVGWWVWVPTTSEARPSTKWAKHIFSEVASAKMCFAHFVDGRASLVVGTHTHQPTADHQILNGGTAYISDAGMCGDYDSSLGMDKEEPLNRFLSKVPKGRFEAAGGPATVCGVGVDVSDRTGLAERIAPLRLGPRLEETVPAFWR